MTTARTVRQAGLLAVLAVAGTAGCVERKFVIESNVPNAQVYIDNRSIGAAPAYSSFDYYGYYTITVIHPGYETVIKRQHVVAPWYAYPPFDLLTEVMPFHIHDTRRLYIELTEAAPIRSDDILNKADELRLRGMMLPEPERPAEPRPNRNPPNPPAPIIQPPVPPGPGPVPGPAPSPVPGPAPGIVPNVAPGYTPAFESTYIK